jgi:peptidoglycan/xylan/chitin deacetylase (PgdA/CDA1 family)
MSKGFVSLTFDDGRQEQYSTYYPILDEYGLTATFYVVTERVGWKGVIGWDDVITLYKDGNEIGSHTHTHPHLTTLPNHQLDFEFQESLRLLRPFNCSTLAYPFGEYDDRVIEHARKYFRAARGYYNSSTENGSLGLNVDPTQERYRLSVFPIEHTTSLKSFEALASCPLLELPFARFKATLTELLEHAVNRKAWLIFLLHGEYHGKNIAPKKHQMLKFKWMCEALAQHNHLEVLPVSEVAKKYSTAAA